MSTPVLNDARTTGVLSPTLRGISRSAILFAAGTILFALVLVFAELPKETCLIVQTAIGLLSVFIGGLVAARSANSNGWLLGLLVGAVFAAIYYLALMTGPSTSLAMVDVAKRLVLVVVAGVLGGIIGVNL